MASVGVCQAQDGTAGGSYGAGGELKVDNAGVTAEQRAEFEKDFKDFDSDKNRELDVRFFKYN